MLRLDMYIGGKMLRHFVVYIPFCVESAEFFTLVDFLRRSGCIKSFTRDVSVLEVKQDFPCLYSRRKTN